MITKYRKLENPPIIEALINIGAEVEAFDVEEINKYLPANIRSEYPEASVIHDGQFEASIRLGESTGEIKSKNPEPVGLMLRNTVNTKVLQFRKDGMGLSRLEPYESFDIFEREAKENWEAFKGLVKLKRVQDVSLLYINLLECGSQVSSASGLNKVVDLFKKPDEQIFGNMVKSSSSLIYRKSSEEIFAKVGVRTVHHTQTNETGVELKINCWQRFSESPREEEVWGSIQKLRQYKNDIFFGSVTDEKLKSYGIVRGG